MIENTINLINDLQIIGEDHNSIWLLGLVSLTISGKRFKALYSEYKHGSSSSYYTRKFEGSVFKTDTAYYFEGFAKLLPHDGFSTVGELVLTSREPFVKNLKTIPMKSKESSSSFEIMLKNTQIV